jgi:hypothetical protein
VPPDARAIRRSLRTDFEPGPKTRLKRLALRLRQAAHLPALWTGGVLERPVFIFGAPRSGTSLLYSMVRSAPGTAHWPGEAHEIWEADYHPALRGWTSNALDASDVTPEGGRRIRRSFFLVAGPHRRLVDKTPRNAMRVAFVDALFPDATFVFLKRDGRDNVSSLINAWRTPRYRTYFLPEPHHIPGVDPRWWKFVLYPGWRDDLHGPVEVVCARQWAASNDLALDAAAGVAGGRWIEVRYEDLVAEPDATIADLLERLGLDYSPAVRAKVRAIATTPINAVTPPEPGKWRRENATEIEAVSDVIAPTMRRLGYELG